MDENQFLSIGGQMEDMEDMAGGRYVFGAGGQWGAPNAVWCNDDVNLERQTARSFREITPRQ